MAESIKIRKEIGGMFSDALASLPFKRRKELKILDVGCGLGFLGCLCAKFYKNSHITGIDTFEDDSLKDASIAKAEENARILGLSDRVDFLRKDLLKFRPHEKFDILVSNLVFHNLGKKRFKGYSCLLSWMHDGSFVVMGELFFSPKKDLAYLAKSFRIMQETGLESDGSGRYAMLVMSKNPG